MSWADCPRQAASGAAPRGGGQRRRVGVLACAPSWRGQTLGCRRFCKFRANRCSFAPLPTQTMFPPTRRGARPCFGAPRSIRFACCRPHHGSRAHPFKSGQSAHDEAYALFSGAVSCARSQPPSVPPSLLRPRSGAYFVGFSPIRGSLAPEHGLRCVVGAGVARSLGRCGCCRPQPCGGGVFATLIRSLRAEGHVSAGRARTSRDP